ncbi:thiol-disulfide oxidoreductase DCC family protein [Alkalibacillus salilacus]|uniref:DCC family thiol-disulfide oxidoreductase YuxK n=1 Tax=Alkalibacillus salilacus TaxID=284582 RepID=A0ABT9VGK7_9BACI|nr:DCC1-like thiol-disulfide oxidoreductase family protein [Alkalibacillus salilacus]MDQ0160037.1 putative DCC family thiol-disulfide oxidoreductase YuxK [Alkalibacillus salilacus]
MKTVIFFDGVCNLCNGIVQWLIERDHHDSLRFAPLQSDLGQRVLDDTGTPDLDSIIVIRDKQRYVKSDAVLIIAEELDRPYQRLSLLKWLPKQVLDVGYDFIANNRKRIFGERESCMMPTPDLKRKFLDVK